MQSTIVMLLVAALALLGCSSEVVDARGGAGGSGGGGGAATGGSGGTGDTEEVTCPEGLGYANDAAHDMVGKPCGAQVGCTVTGACDWCEMSCEDGVWALGDCGTAGPEC